MRDEAGKSFLDKLKTKFFLILIALVFAFPILPNAIQSISIIALICLSVTSFLKNKKFNLDRKQVVFYTLITSWAFFLCLTIFYSKDTIYGIATAQRYINIIAIPLVLIFFVPKNFIKKAHIFYLSFIISNLLFVFIIYYKAIIVIETTCFPEIYYDNFFSKLNFILKKPNHIIFSCFENESKHSFFIHRVYNSMNFLFSILLLIELIFMNKFKKNIGFYLLSIISFIVFGYLIFYQFSVVNVVLALVLIPTFIITKTPINKVKKSIFVSVIFVVVCFVVINLNKTSNNVASKYLIPAVNMVKKVFTGNNYGSIDERYEINIASKSLIEDAFLFGYGIGDVQSKLNEYYFLNKNNSEAYAIAYKNELNTHNNYAFLMLSGGIVVIILFLINVIFSFSKGINSKEWIYVYFLIIILVNLASENILSRIHGNLFYAIFNGFFIAKMLNTKNYE